jgi:aryl-alcohol dehydrogenase-like predicted oxidoreductase
MIPVGYRRLGASGLEVSSLCLGTMNFGTRTDAAPRRRIIDSAFDPASTSSTLDAYGDGESERIVGAAIAARRRHWILATKAGNVLTRRPHDGGLSRRWLLAACDDSLARLGLDHVDIYYLHRDDPGTPLAETVGAIGDLVRAGKIRYFGVSNYRGWRIAALVDECRAQRVAPPVVCQPYYNLLNRMPEFEVLPACDYFGLGVAPYSPLARGVLTAKYRADGSGPQDSRAAIRDARFMETEFRTESLAIAAKLAEHVAKTGTLAQFALARLGPTLCD